MKRKKVEQLVLAFIACSALCLSLFFASCNHGKNNDGKKEGETQEAGKIVLNFGVVRDNGGSLIAKVAGAKIESGKELAKDTEIVFTAKPKDKTWSIEKWTLKLGGGRKQLLMAMKLATP